MIINDFLHFKLGVNFDDCYNKLAVEEIIKNKESYPIIYEDIKYMVDDIENYNYDSSFFDCDDEFCAGYDETMELYKAFVKVFIDDVKQKNLDLDSFSTSIYYLKKQNKFCMLDPYYNYSGAKYIELYKDKRLIGQTVISTNDAEEEYYYNSSKKDVINTTYYDNVDILNSIKDKFLKTENLNYFCLPQINNEDLKKGEELLDQKVIGYPFNCYTFIFGDNVLKVPTTDKKQIELINNTFKSIILDNLTEEEKEHQVVIDIFK